MKKLILSVSAVAGLSLAGHAQGIVFADGAANASGASDVTINGLANTTQDLNLELLYGTSAGAVTTPIVTLLLSSSATPITGTIGGTYAAAGDVSALGNILDNSGQEYNLAAGSYFFQVLGWTGSSATYPGQTPGATDGASVVFAETIAAAPAPPGDVSGVGVLALTTVAVPEPSTLAMAGVGLASMLFFRRRNK